MSGRVKKHQIIVFCFLFLLWWCLFLFFFPHLCTFCECVLVCIGRRCNLSLGAMKLNGPRTDIYKRNLGILLHTISYSFVFFFFKSRNCRMLVVITAFSRSPLPSLLRAAPRRRDRKGRST